MKRTRVIRNGTSLATHTAAKPYTAAESTHGFDTTSLEEVFRVLRTTMSPEKLVAELLMTTRS